MKIQKFYEFNNNIELLLNGVIEDYSQDFEIEFTSAESNPDYIYGSYFSDEFSITINDLGEWSGDKFREFITKICLHFKITNHDNTIIYNDISLFELEDGEITIDGSYSGDILKVITSCDEKLVGERFFKYYKIDTSMVEFIGEETFIYDGKEYNTYDVVMDMDLDELYYSDITDYL